MRSSKALRGLNAAISRQGVRGKVEVRRVCFREMFQIQAGGIRCLSSDLHVDHRQF